MNGGGWIRQSLWWAGAEEEQEEMTRTAFRLWRGLGVDVADGEGRFLDEKGWKEIPVVWRFRLSFVPGLWFELPLPRGSGREAAAGGQVGGEPCRPARRSTRGLVGGSLCGRAMQAWAGPSRHADGMIQGGEGESRCFRPEASVWHVAGEALVAPGVCQSVRAWSRVRASRGLGASVRDGTRLLPRATSGSRFHSPVNAVVSMEAPVVDGVGVGWGW